MQSGFFRSNSRPSKLQCNYTTRMFSSFNVTLTCRLRVYDYHAGAFFVHRRAQPPGWKQKNMRSVYNVYVDRWTPPFLRKSYTQTDASAAMAVAIVVDLFDAVCRARHQYRAQHYERMNVWHIRQTERERESESMRGKCGWWFGLG